MEITKTSLFNLIKKASGSYWNFNASNSNDVTGSNNGTDTSISYSIPNGLFGVGAGFNGSSSFINLGNPSSLQITGALSLGVWVKTSVTSGVLLVKGTNNSATSFSYDLTLVSGVPTLFLSDGSTDKSAGAVNSIADGNWHHIVGVYVPSTSIKIYIDGVLAGINTSSIYSSIQNISANVAIGSDAGGARYFTGDMDDVFIVPVALTAQQVAQIYNTDATTLGLTNTNSLGFYSSASQYVSVSDTSNLKPTGNFTIEGFIKTTLSGTGYIFQSFSKNLNYAGLFMYISSGNIVFGTGKNSGTTQGTDWQQVTGSKSVNDGQWHHIAGVYDGSKLYIYVDGVLDSSTSWTNAPAYAVTNYVIIGSDDFTGVLGNYFDGLLNDIRLFNGTAKTQAQIQADMVNSTLVLTTNLVARWKFNSSSGTTATDSINGYNGTLTGYTSGFEGWSGDVPYPGNTILPYSFRTVRSQTQYATIPNASSLDITSDLTIGSYVKFNSTPSSGSGYQILAKWGATANKRSYELSLPNVSGTLKLQFEVSSDGTSTNATAADVAWTPSTGVWYWVVAVYTAAAGSVAFYVNGVQQGTTQTGMKTSIYSGTEAFLIGAYDSGSPGSPFDGTISQIFITNNAWSGGTVSANYQKDLTSASGIQMFDKLFNNALDAYTTNANNITTFTNTPVFITDVPFSSYVTATTTNSSMLMSFA